ncbi:MAG: acetylglutamate kinase [Phycisphaerales bacterium]|nr:acetylglutamate kinase [Phycisphaerales bacterium]
MSVVVVKLGGRGVDAAVAREPIIDAVARMAAHERLVIVHGGGGAIDARLDRLGIEADRVQGLRVTTEAVMDEVVAALAGNVNHALVGALISRDVACAGLTLAGAGIGCHRRPPINGVDLGLVGVVDGDENAHQVDGVLALLGAGVLPVISCVGADDDGRPLNVNADDAAAGVAGALGASQLVLLTDTPGVLDANGGLLDRLDRDEIERLIDARIIVDGMIPKVRAAVDMAAKLHAPVRIASWADADAQWWRDPNAPGGTVIVDGKPSAIGGVDRG